MNQVRDLEKYGWAVKEDVSPRLSEKAIDSIADFFAAAGAEYAATGSVLGHGRGGMFRVRREHDSECYGRPCALPFGPSASPLTIDLPGIVSAYLSGARCFELPVHAALARAANRPGRRKRSDEEEDEPRPALRVLRDFSLARFAVLALGRIFSLDPDSGPLEPCVFSANFSAEMDEEESDFLEALKDGREAAMRDRILEELGALAAGPDPFAGTDMAGRLAKSTDLGKRAHRGLVAALVIALPDGLPLKEAEPALMELVSESGMPAELKLGPWVLGGERLEDILRRSGIERDSRLFGRNAATRYSSAIMTVRRLFTLARERSVFFGLRIDGSLPASIGRPLPGRSDAGTYLSGQGSFACALALAARVSEDLSGTLPLSFSGGLDAEKAAFLFKSGLRPLGVATSLYSPEGFGALRPIAEAIDAVDGKVPGPRDRAQIDVRALRDRSNELLG